MKGTLILTMGLVAMVALVGCGANNPAGPGAGGFVVAATKEVSPGNDLIGTWQMQGGVGPPAVITFKADGQVEINDVTDDRATETFLGTYQVEGTRLTLTAGNTNVAPYILERFTTYTYFIEGNLDGNIQLTLANADGMTKWVKM